VVKLDYYNRPDWEHNTLRNISKTLCHRYNFPYEQATAWWNLFLLLTVTARQN
jgi:hypothetical protein